MSANALAQLKAGMALLAQAPEEHLIRRCIVHHVELDAQLDCPTGLHPTEQELALQHGARYAVTIQWEVYNVRTGLVECRVLGDFRLEWHEEPEEDRTRIAGRDCSGLLKGVRLRKFGRLHVAAGRRRPSRRATAA